MIAHKMQLVLTIALFVGLANSRPNNDAIVTMKNDKSKFCGCSEEKMPQCGCCVSLRNFIQRDYSVCTNLTYIKSESAVRLTMTANQKILFNETLSGENPPPICEGVGFADLCVKAYNMSYEEHNFGGCLEIYSDMGIDLKMGCHYFSGKPGYPPVAYGEESVYPTKKKIPINYFYQMWNIVKKRILEDVFQWSFENTLAGLALLPDLNQLSEGTIIYEYENEEWSGST